MTDRRWLRDAAARFEENPEYATHQAHRALGMSPESLVAVCEVAEHLRRGEKLGAKQIDAMQKVYPAIPRAILESRANELNAVADANGRVRQFFHVLAGNNAARYQTLYENFQSR